MPGRFTNGPEPQLTEDTRVRNTLLKDQIFDFSINVLTNGTIEVIVATTSDEIVLASLAKEGEFTKN